MNFFDLHCDTPYECYLKNYDFSDPNLAVNETGIQIFEEWYECFAVFVKDGTEKPFDFYKAVYNNFIDKLPKSDNLHPIFTVEGGIIIEKDISRLETLKNDGIKSLTLCWNGENAIAGGADTESGIKAFGKDVIREMNRLNMACDLSHLNRRSFFDCAEIGECIFASHSCCNHIFNHKRNLSDDQLKIIAEKKGVVGICLYPRFLGGDVFEKTYENIFHLLDMGMEEYISIGSDFDGCEMPYELKSIVQIPDLYTFLIEKGIDKVILNKIFYGNALKFFTKL